MRSTLSTVATLLAQILRDLGLDVIAIDRSTLQYIPVDIRGKSEEMLHHLANLILLRKAYVCLEEVYGVPTGFYKGITLLYTTKKSFVSKATIVNRDAKCLNNLTSIVSEKLEILIPRAPLFIVDLSLWELHHEKEKHSLVKQLVLMIHEIRKWLTDLNIVFVSTPINVVQELQNITSNKSMYFVTDEFYKLLPQENTVVLDPYSLEELTEQDIKIYNYFIIGGVVDKLFPRPYATYTIYKLHRLNFVRKSIKLYGSNTGVPNELNKIVNIIISVKLLNTNLNEAIKMNMSVDDKIVRINRDLMKIARTKKVINEDDIVNLMKLYALNEKYKYKIFKLAKKFMRKNP